MVRVYSGSRCKKRFELLLVIQVNGFPIQHWSTSVDIFDILNVGILKRIRIVSSSDVLYVTSNTKSKLSLLYRYKNPNKLREFHTK